MNRQRLPSRRQGVTEPLTYRKGEPCEVRFDVTFNWEEGGDWRTRGPVREVFCMAFKEGTDLRTLLHHACIMTSIALQRGETMAGLAHTLGEGDPNCKPGSILGLIVRAGAAVDAANGAIGRAVR